MKDIHKNIEKQLSSEAYQYLKVFTYRSYRLFNRDYYCDVCLVKNIDKKKVFIRVQKRWYGISKNMKAKGVKKPQWIIIKSYNFPQKYEFERTRRIFNQISKGNLKVPQLIEETTGVDLAVDEIKSLKNRLKKLEKKKRKDKNSREEIVKLKDQVKSLDTENKELKKDLLKSRIPEFRDVIKVAKANLDKKGENYFQKLLKGNDWIFGPGYEEVISKRKADPENQPDFILKRYDGFSDIVEIEKPDKPLFTKPNISGKAQPSAPLIQAISQAMDYIDSYNEKFKDLLYQDMQKGISNPIHSYYPRGFVMIGRDKNTDRKKLRQLNNFLHNIAVLTYDEFLRQSERMIDMLGK